MTGVRHFLLPSLLLALAAPVSSKPNSTELAAQRAALASLQTTDLRVATIGYRLATVNVALCGDSAALSGFSVHALAQYAPSYRDAAATAFGLNDQPAVLAVVPRSAAERAGLKAGDRIVAIQGAVVLPAPLRSKGDYAPTAAIEQAVEGGLAAPPLRLDVDRAGKRLTIATAGDPGCRSRVQVVPSGRLNASADGRYVQLSTRVVDFAGGDDALAFLIAHEMAHNILRHADRLEAEGVGDGLFSRLGKNARRVRDTEVEADHMALFLMARAGYDLGAVPALMDRLGRKSDYGIFSDGTHPARKDRVAMIEQGIAEIAALRARGQPLIPVRPPE